VATWFAIVFPFATYRILTTGGNVMISSAGMMSSAGVIKVLELQGFWHSLS
jgi:hypothetical protein